jgi:hypothetical protein
MGLETEAEYQFKRYDGLVSGLTAALDFGGTNQRASPNEASAKTGEKAWQNRPILSRLQYVLASQQPIRVYTRKSGNCWTAGRNCQAALDHSVLHPSAPWGFIADHKLGRG